MNFPCWCCLFLLTLLFVGGGGRRRRRRHNFRALRPTNHRNRRTAGIPNSGTVGRFLFLMLGGADEKDVVVAVSILGPHTHTVEKWKARKMFSVIYSFIPHESSGAMWSLTLMRWKWVIRCVRTCVQVQAVVVASRRLFHLSQANKQGHVNNKGTGA